MSEHKIFGQDIYWANFIGLMVLTAIEVVAVGSEFSKAMTLFILVGIAIPKFIMIAAIFMHLWGDKDSKILTLTALFPTFFIIVMVLFIGLTHPEATTGLPEWCRPGYYKL
ncbi:MAG: cytochrome C oxidase subunit IV family protein [Euryarchaeota archaeon]|jgi:heme/copper-type cytochrome/quinol oxidase subunit 4|nr:cytochrome C oxidase subunit IV family protein [Euryarchaeota archaeon]MBT4391764.1 cytochrome C oxidase subunit IV family protein [Euryarchaeota archaeon]MBT4802120.1 cytochrome C oxidase subunit IV family protein [Euryarchaeota archaeon]MBT5613462.1 cytochrome C oxidase subunit IV family protein [Euryarchaeota archaeon]MBT6683323.1 cytochrome C oxidase subunit IV family protein [Euryarchaeota archaeon]|tara:strand:+ start:27331 stop:27663 length:333 start_codon:yes stop_codon:yes gene_type:complete